MLHRARPSALVAGLAVVVAGVLAGCGTTSTTPPSSTSTTQPEVIGTTTTVASAGGVQDLPVTAALQAALLAAGAASHELPVSDYTGLTAGMTFYAYDASSGTYWAGAQLVPSPNSTEAQIGAQDDGSYDVFVKTGGGAWKAYNDGLGTLPGSTCSIVVPASVRTVWGWSLSAPCGGPHAL